MYIAYHRVSTKAIVKNNENIANIPIRRYTTPMRHDKILETEYIYIWHTESVAEKSMQATNYHSDVIIGDSPVTFHCHPECEILYIIRGDVTILAENQVYYPSLESLVLLPPNVAHSWKSESQDLFHRISIHFLPECLDPDELTMFMELFKTVHYFPIITPVNINVFVQSILMCEKMEEPLRTLSYKNRLVGLLSEILLLRSKDRVEPEPLDKRIQNVLKYLDKHLREKIYLDTVSRECNISKNHLNVLFRRATGTTIKKYLQIKRLGLAHQTILNGANIQEAADKAGFNDYSAFYRAYKAFYHRSPSTPIVGKPDM
jgi:AraC-like DNA-binding protein